MTFSLASIFFKSKWEHYIASCALALLWPVFLLQWHSFERVLRLESLVLWLEILYTPTDPYILNGLTDFLTNFKTDNCYANSNKSVPIVYKTLLKNTNWIKDIPLTLFLTFEKQAKSNFQSLDAQNEEKIREFPDRCRYFPELTFKHQKR